LSQQYQMFQQVIGLRWPLGFQQKLQHFLAQRRQSPAALFAQRFSLLKADGKVLGRAGEVRMGHVTNVGCCDPFHKACASDNPRSIQKRATLIILRVGNAWLRALAALAAGSSARDSTVADSLKNGPFRISIRLSSPKKRDFTGFLL
jgi:hypothetical protein